MARIAGVAGRCAWCPPLARTLTAAWFVVSVLRFAPVTPAPLWAQDSGGLAGAPQADWNDRRPFGEFTRQYYGVYFVSYVADRTAEVYVAPRRSNEPINRLAAGDRVVITGMSANMETVHGRHASWLRISFGDPLNRLRDQPDSYPTGWIFGAAVEGFDGVAAINAELPQSPGPFVWTTGAEGFRYSHVPGTYVRIPGQSTVRHLTYRGGIIEARMPTFTPDYRYMIQDFGTGPGLRAFSIIELQSDAVVASGSYMGRLDFDGTTVPVVFPVRWDLRVGADPPHQVRSDLAACVPLVGALPSAYGRFRFNIHTREYTFVDCVVDSN